MMGSVTRNKSKTQPILRNQPTPPVSEHNRKTGLESILSITQKKSNESKPKKINKIKHSIPITNSCIRYKFTSPRLLIPPTPPPGLPPFFFFVPPQAPCLIPIKPHHSQLGAISPAGTDRHIYIPFLCSKRPQMPFPRHKSETAWS